MRLLALVAPIAIVVAVACSNGSTTTPPSSNDVDAGATADASDPSEAGVDDAGTLAPLNATNAVVVVNGVSRTLEYAQFGVTKSDDTLFVEANEGGVAACPETADPKRKLILSGVPNGAAGRTFTKADGVAISLLDLTGDQIPSNPPSIKATAATVTIVAIDEDTSVELEIDATFAEGTAKGRIYAKYCAALSE